MHPSTMPRILAALVIASVSLFVSSSALAQGDLVLTDLTSPRGLTATGPNLLVADQGNGRILRVSPSGSVMVIADGLPSLIEESPEGPQPVGVTSVINVGAAYLYTVGESSSAGFDSVYSVTIGGEPVLIADLKAYEEANNTDGDVDRTGEPELLSNPYDLVSDGGLGLYVSASGANAILHISASGAISPFAVFPNRANPLFPAIGGPTMDQVPTGLEVGPDGALYVSTLTGFPFPTGEARVYRIEDQNDDGDALDDGETTIYASGLTTATNLAFDLDGSLLVTEFSTDMLAQAPGRLVRVVDGAIAEVVAEPLISPTGLAVMRDGQIVVSQEFLGIVAEANVGAKIASQGPPGGPPPDVEIKPPATGDAGLAAAGFSNSASLVLLAVVAVLLSGSGAVLALQSIARRPNNL